MAERSPLSPAKGSTLNQISATPPTLSAEKPTRTLSNSTTSSTTRTVRTIDQYEVQTYTEQSTSAPAIVSERDSSSRSSSPFISDVDDSSTSKFAAAAAANNNPNLSTTDDIENSDHSNNYNTNTARNNPTSVRFQQFMTNLQQQREHREKENMTTPSRQRHSRIMSGNELSPLKILSTNEPPEKLDSPARASRKSILSPERRFPVRVSNPLNDVAESPSRASDDVASIGSADSPQSQSRTSSRPTSTTTRTMSLEDALRDNKGLAKAIEIFEDEDSQMKDADDGEDHDMEHAAHHDSSIDEGDQSDSTQVHHEQHHEHVDESVGPDDTMMSAFSNFSAVPNMTMLARLGHSPTKLSATTEDMTPRPKPHATPNGRPMTFHPDSSGNTTNLLMDFTDQLRNPGRTPSTKQGAPAPGSNGVPDTPARGSNLLDFDIPPLPTPRSVPSITPRELESLKSNFLSEISGLKATLSGKEAEVTALKTAVGDAEKRVGQSLEQVREITAERDQLSVEKEGWEKRSREMEPILRSVREEIMHVTRQRDELENKFAENEGRREAAETMAQEAESKLAAMRAGRASEENAKKASPGGAPLNSTKEVEMAVERVARELHALYKTKHESKVSALKKSYEGRWEKKVRELESRIEEMTQENDHLRLGRDATMTRLNPQEQAAEEERKEQAVRDQAQLKELGAEVNKLEAMMKTVRDDNSELRTLLEQERVEKGELVQLAEEMMSMQSFVASEKKQQAQQHQAQQQRPQSASPRRASPTPGGPAMPARTPAKMRTPGPTSRMQQPGDSQFRTSGSRMSGIKAPGSSIVMPGRSAPGAGGNHERTRSQQAGGLPRPGSGIGRSGIMSSIEKMGNYRGRGE